MIIIILLSALLFGNTSTELIEVIHVDLLEYHHYYNQRGEHCFDQTLIWKNHNDKLKCFGYILIDWDNAKSAIPTKVGGFYRVKKRVGNRFVLVVSQFYRESWSQEDPYLISLEKNWNGDYRNMPDIFSKYSMEKTLDHDE